MTITSTKLDEIIKAFEEWYVNDIHSKIEDFYLDTITFENISKLSQKEFEDFFLEFAREGGKIQSGGYRTANNFIKNVHENYTEFRQRILAPFQSNFDISDWIRWSDSFKFFGKGLATIYLNRVNKRKFVVVNNKSIEAYGIIGYEISQSPLERIYLDIFNAQTDLINKYSELSNFFKADSLAHFLIGTEEGRSFIKNMGINYWVFQGNPEVYKIIDAISDNALETWSVKAHKNEIKKGDKVIIWVTGHKQGCYALCEVTSNVFEGYNTANEMNYGYNQSINEKSPRVGIRITHNLSSNPITRSQIAEKSELSDLKIGIQGTNFSATEVEYKTLLRIAETSNNKFSITKDNVLKAIEIIDNNPSLRKGRESIEYDLIFNNKKYPPILVLSEANKIPGGHELLLSDFGNSTRNAFQILSNLGFIIERKKMSFYEQLIKFLSQSDNGTLTTSGYPDYYEGLKVKVSFGQGNQARIPWIAFLGEGNTVPNGIYPVYLYFKSLNVLILAYGVSENNIPSTSWNLAIPKSISDYFDENQLGRPERYGSSFVFKVYNKIDSLKPDEIDKDLTGLIEIYKRNIADQHSKKPVNQVDFNYKSFKESTDTANLLLDINLILRFISALLTKPFVILTGLSGSGKTKLAQAFAKWICETENQTCIVPVGADWTNREPLLGFPSALEQGRYIFPDNGVLSLIMEASKEKNQNKPFILILDEMNLSHVERYFADFLSVMESNGRISLHEGPENWNGIPSEIELPSNLFIIGTVNIDETTYMFSPKVLDRANVIEFRVTPGEMKDFLSKNTVLELNKLKSAGADMAASFIKIAQDISLKINDSNVLQTELLIFFSELKKTGAEFGYRSAAEISRFATVVNTIEPDLPMIKIIDAAVMQKLLPKVHGSRRKLEPVLKTLGNLCLQPGQNFDDYIAPKSEVVFNDSERIKYPISLEKILRMYQGLIDNGFTSYAEA